ncbi:MAG TPA: LysR family transcriptional regulator [Brevundimonas sp.]|nr:LysR family transcriptional regulator [Brevundimonas sp.]
MPSPRPSSSALPLKAMHAFDLVMRLGGVGRAAERLGVTHGAVSRQIGHLQTALGLRLFEGPRNARHPTAEAERLWTEIGPAFGQLEAAAGARMGSQQRLRVSCLSTLAARWLIPRLPDFAAAHPESVVELSESYAAPARALDGADLAIRMLAEGATTPAGLTAVPFMDNAFGLVVAPHRAEDADRRLVSRSHPGAWRDWATLSGQAVPELPSVEFDHQQTMIQAAVAGLGVAVTQKALIEADLAQGRLTAPAGFVRDGAAYAVFHRSEDAGKTARTFIAWLCGQDRKPHV